MGAVPAASSWFVNLPEASVDRSMPSSVQRDTNYIPYSQPKFEGSYEGHKTAMVALVVVPAPFPRPVLVIITVLPQLAGTTPGVATTRSDSAWVWPQEPATGQRP